VCRAVSARLDHGGGTAQSRQVWKARYRAAVEQGGQRLSVRHHLLLQRLPPTHTFSHHAFFMLLAQQQAAAHQAPPPSPHLHHALQPRAALEGGLAGVCVLGVHKLCDYAAVTMQLRSVSAQLQHQLVDVACGAVAAGWVERQAMASEWWWVHVNERPKRGARLVQGKVKMGLTSRTGSDKLQHTANVGASCSAQHTHHSTHR
jgi:hypothetical protein